MSSWISQWDQILSLIGAFLILGAFALQNFWKDHLSQKLYLSLNVLGAGALTVTAVVNEQWGFVVLEGTWTMISLYSLSRLSSR